MKKLLFVTTVGGFITKFEMDSVKCLKSMEYEVHYAADFTNPMYAESIEDNKRQLENAGVILHQINIRKSPFDIISCVKAVKQVKYIIKKTGINVIHCHTPMGAVVARLAAGRGKGKKRPFVIYTAHGFHFYKGAPLLNWIIYYPVEKWLAARTDALVTINKEDYMLASKKFHLVKGGKVYQIPGVGYDSARFNSQVRKKGDENPTVVITTVAELSPNKNQMTVLRAIELLQKVQFIGHNKNYNVLYKICGQSSNDNNKYEIQLKEYIEKNNLSDYVEFTGYKSDVTEVLKGTDIFVFPSVREGLGMAAIEALACGVPVIAAKNRGSVEYIKQAENGYLYDAMDYVRLAELIKGLVKEPDKRKTLGDNAAESVERFTKDRTICITKKIYEDMDNRINERIQ